MIKMIRLIVVIAFLFSQNTVHALDETVFTDFNGASKTLDLLKGDDNWLVLMIWASYCPVCNKEAQSYVRFYEAEKNSNISLVGLSVDGKDNFSTAEDFVKTHHLPFPNLIAEIEEVMLFYQEKTFKKFNATPTFMIFSPDGALMAARTGAVEPEAIKKFISQKSGQ